MGQNLFSRVIHRIAILKKILSLVVLRLSILLPVFCSYAAEVVPVPDDDPHYTDVGFFDIHVCNWPNQPLFFLALFSSYQYQELAQVEIRTPQGDLVGRLDFNKFRVIRQKGKPLKKAFIKHFDIPTDAVDGWYNARITLKDGRRFAAQDYVVLRKMPLATNLVPSDGAEDIANPRSLKWNPIPGAKYYQVFITDNWEGKVIHMSKLLAETKLDLPRGLLQPGGYYSWRIHARDVQGNVLLGDFNHGSLSRRNSFTVASE